MHSKVIYIRQDKCTDVMILACRVKTNEGLKSVMQFSVFPISNIIF